MLKTIPGRVTGRHTTKPGLKAGELTTRKSNVCGARKACGVPQTRRRKRIGAATAGYQIKAAASDEVWALDFQIDATENGKAIKICTIIDAHARQTLGGIVARSITASDVTAELERIAVLRGGYPQVLRSDNGPEFISQKLTTRAENRVGLAYIPPGQPWPNGYVESF